MVDVTALEREYLAATRPSAFDARRARLALDALHEASADPSLLVLYEAKLLAQVEPARRDESLKTMIDHMRDTDNIAPRIAAQFCVMASKHATNTYNRDAQAFVLDYANRLWTSHSDDDDVMRWRPAVELNAGILYVRTNDLAKAQAHLSEMLRTFRHTPDNFCWLTLVNVNLAIVHARLGEIEYARVCASDADSTGMPYDEDIRSLAWGEISLAQQRYEDARTCLRKAYRLAKDAGKSEIMTDAQLALCRVYREVDNIDAFWYAYERANDVAKENGLVHVLDALSAISAGVHIT